MRHHSLYFRKLAMDDIAGKGIRVEYDDGSQRSTLVFKNMVEARRFYQGMHLQGKNPKIVGESKDGTKDEDQGTSTSNPTNSPDDG